MKSLRKTLVSAALMAGVLVGASAAWAGETVIANGQTIGGFRGSPQSMQVARIYVPAGARRFVVSTSGGSGDCDLYIRREQAKQGSWDFISTSNSNNERIALAMPAEGWWQIGLMGASDYSDLTLHAQFDEPQQQLQPQPQPVVQSQPAGQSQPVVQPQPAGQPQPQPAEVLQTTGVDEFEPNSKRDLAMQIFTGQPQAHTINPDGDEDWIMFVPRRSGKYLLQLTNVTADLEGELWVQAGRDKEKRVEKFEIPRGRDSEILLEVDAAIGYFKLKIEADDNDDVGSYLLSAKQTHASVDGGIKVRRPDVFESDNRPDVAVGILDNNTQLRTIYPRDDEDWLVFAPTRPGEYLLKFSDVTTDLKCELWVLRGDDKERRIDKFDVSRWGRTISLRADHEVRYFKIRIEADDNDETGDYRLDVVPRSFTTAQMVVRTTVIYPTLRIPPFYRYHKLYRHRYPRGYGHKLLSHYGRSTRGRHSGRSVGITSGIRGSVLLDTGKVRIGVGIGRSSRIAPTLGRSSRTAHSGHSRSRTTSPGRGRGLTTTRTSTHTSTPTRSTVRTPIRSPARTTVRTPTRTATRISTPIRSTVRTPIRIPTRTTVRTPSRTATRISTPTRSTVRTPVRIPTRTTVRTPSRSSSATRRLLRLPIRSHTQTKAQTPSRMPIRTSTATRAPVRTSIPTPRTVRTPIRIPARSTVRTPSRVPSRSSTATRRLLKMPTRTSNPTRHTLRTPNRTPTRAPTKTTVQAPNRTKARKTTATPQPTESARSRTRQTYRGRAKRKR